MNTKSITLGERLQSNIPHSARLSFLKRLQYGLLRIAQFGVLVMFIALLLWHILTQPEIDILPILIALACLIASWLFFRNRLQKVMNSPPIHSLLAHDRQGFMRDLKLDAKTAVFDGSNIYHFGHDNGVDAQPLGLLAQQLRIEGYRIVCFFDANIFYTLQGHGAFTTDTTHSLDVLTDIFGLYPHEIYIVPSGTDADLYVLNTLKHLPISFAITNDQYRDYSKRFGDVMKGQWRKGTIISKGEVKLLQHKLEAPLRIG